MIIDFWYDHKRADIEHISIYFYPNNGYYSGNLYDSNYKIIGDYTTKDSTEIKKYFRAAVKRDRYAI